MDYQEIYDYIVKIQSIAKIGLVFSKDPYALTNYQQINDISLQMLEKFMEVEFDRPNFFQRDIYPTPSISIRTIIFSKDKTKRQRKWQNFFQIANQKEKVFFLIIIWQQF